jgi:hypothetical protein
MNHPIYLLISIVIGTSIILIVMRTTLYISDANQEAFYEEKVFQNFVTTQQILEYYLKKGGYRSSGNPVIEADSTRIKFLCDEDDNGVADTLEIKLGLPAESSSNPNDYELILTKNSKSELIAPDGVTNFKLEYLDLNGNPTNEKLFIRFIIVNLRVESTEPFRDRYLFYEDKFTIRPKNLG